MKKSVCIFLLAVLLPSVVLGWLALRSAGEQQIILERRTAELYQAEAENFAAAARSLIDDERLAFAAAVRKLVAAENPDALAERFATALAGAWPRRAVGFAIGREGRLLAPTPRDALANFACAQFLTDNRGFLGARDTASVYPVEINELTKPELLKGKTGSKQVQQILPAPDAAQQPQTFNENRARNVVPQQAQAKAAVAPTSSLLAETTDFRRLAAERDEGMVTRFVQNRLDLILWLRPAQKEARHLIFGCMIDSADLRDLWPAILPENGRAEFAVALLDDKARPVVAHPAGVERDWKRPFAAAEIGEALPHWEAALYLLRPEQLQESARAHRRTLAFLIAAALGAITLGGWLVVADARRQLVLAQQKTDFVSNVSHELKTPLTSIRMFAELMLGGRADAEKAPRYLRIIMVEAERLTRLINNVLDFAKLDRGQKRLEMRPLDLREVIARTWEAIELHLREAGFATRWDAVPGPYPVNGDEDALAQILVNLLSNAEKYSGDARDIALRTTLENGAVGVSVLDRGPGVPPGEERKIFVAFHRAHDSLASGIQGSGLGLTLAQHLAREHGGEITHHPRAGGGSEFTLRLPLRAADR